ncbi:MAG: hypothetical protein A2X84_03005 [Desulfuromonadaceae bacterium GWC2_58_13]|nr:MAG: hypothetical protein A2X84_03005 [Desulfuromonadaceae bacterium GWC2_58_13]
MLDLPQQGPLLTAMGMMAPQTIQIARIPAKVGLFHFRFGLVTTEAQAAPGGFEQAVVGTTVRIMTGIALSRLKGFVHVGITLLGLFMTGETKISSALGQQTCIIGSVGRMAAAARPFLNRLMHNGAVVYPFFQLPMAAEAKHFLFLQKQPLMAGHMGTVTLVTTIFSNRRMHHLTAKIGTIMTIKTRCRESRGRRDNNPDEAHNKHDQRRNNPSLHY